ncbi:PDZ domain-containing protein [Roseicyclus sp.]|uniref:PDZ domain-containing protein n=1 Tax=Roseicyclus sp. TaxID=1914329 RepID=UPI001BCE25BA|nr:PDZ domain-containing protein [Roseicyclus sp.]
MNDAATSADAPIADQNLQPFLKLETRGLGFAARAKKLKPGDVLVAIDGEIFTGDAEMLSARMGKPVADHDDNPEVDASELGFTPHLLTFWRSGIVFHVILETRLKASFEVTGPDETLEILRAVQTLKFAPLESYQNFEVFRDIRKNAAMHATDLEEIATIAPVLWMLNHRLYYPMVAVLIVYGITFVAHWFVFVISYVLVSIYTKRAQVDLLRSYKMFEDMFFWMVLAEPGEAEARETCRRFIPDLRFNFEPLPKAKPKTRNPNRLRVTSQQPG